LIAARLADAFFADGAKNRLAILLLRSASPSCALRLHRAFAGRRIRTMRRYAPVLLLAVTSLSLGLGYSGDRPEISRSRGSAHGVVVLWPRVVPESHDADMNALAGKVQAALAAAAGTIVSPEMVDSRPSPQRVCVQEGCRGAAISALIAHQDQGCAIVATVSGPLQADQALIPWAGNVTLLEPRAAFRTPPEQKVRITDFVACATVADALDPAPVAEALRGVATP
jgi:hypothetical protein